MAREDGFVKYSYLIGQKINKWTVHNIYREKSKLYANCTCECGTRKEVAISNLVNNKSKDCGCGRKKTMRDLKTKDLIGQRFGKLKVLEMLEESNKFRRRLYKCKCDCGNECIVSSICLLSGDTASCGCLLSYHNIYIHQLLNKNNIEHEPEFKVVIDGKSYRFDFYLPKYNLFIEYDGQQHFEPVRFRGEKRDIEEEFIKLQERDMIKNKYCEDNNINLLRIPYWEDKNIEKIISNHLQRLSEKDFTNAA